jgi:hypothetical protein
MNERASIYTYIDTRNTRSKKLVGAIFINFEGLNANLICDALDSLYDHSSVPDVIAFILPTTDTTKIRDVFDDERVTSRLRPSSSSNSLYFIHFTPDGMATGFVFDTLTKESSKIDNSFLTSLRNVTLTKWFKTRGGMMESGAGYHFNKPSRKSVNAFIRTGNILVDSNEIDYLIFWLIAYICDEIETIWVDSSTIMSVAYALQQARQKWLDKSTPNVKIKSFESYTNFKSVPKFDGKSLVLISASSGGAMAGDFQIQKHYGTKNIITLFFVETTNSKDDKIGTTICDLTKSKTNSDGYEPLILSRVDEELFPQSSLPIEISAEGFLPHGRKVNSIKITRHHLPNWYTRILPDILLGNVTSVNKSDSRQHSQGGRPKKNLIDFDLQPLWKDLTKKNERKSTLANQLDRYLKSKIPRTLKLLIYVGDEQSKALSRYIENLFKEDTSREISSIPLSDYTSNFKNYTCTPESEDYTLIVGSCLFELEPLLNASQLLRNTQLNDCFGYLVPLLISENETRRKFNASSLTFCNKGANYELSVFGNCEFSWLRERKTPWEAETLFWESLVEDTSLNLSDPEIEAINSRVERLQDPQGLKTDVFLNSPRDTELKLRPNSMLTENTSIDSGDIRITQADVVFMVGALTSNLINKSYLNQSPLHRTLFDPENFNRFSDGVIQAALIRLSLNGELSYALEASFSTKFYKIVSDLLIDPQSQRSEVLTELFYGIASGIIALQRPDKEDLENIISKPRFRKKITNPITNVLIKFLTATS